MRKCFKYMRQRTRFYLILVFTTSASSQVSDQMGLCCLQMDVNEDQASKIALVRSYLRVPGAAGQVKILIFLV